VAPITITSLPFSEFYKSSKLEASYATILTSRSFEAFSLLPAILSSSSIKIIAGAFSLTA
jgi:hypothetical protein